MAMSLATRDVDFFHSRCAVINSIPDERQIFFSFAFFSATANPFSIHTPPLPPLEPIKTSTLLKKGNLRSKNSSAKSLLQDMDRQPTNQSNNNRKHMWDKEEDEKLIECLLQLLESGNWRGDNGTFRSGFLQQLEKWMHEKIPNCQVRATPHISSRVKLWKKQYYALSEMLGASGFGWNDNEKSICCEKGVYDNWIKSHPTAIGLRGKSFPYLEDWSVVFGKDRANGLGAESLTDAVEDIEREEATHEDGPRNVEVDMNDNLGYEELVDSPVDGSQANISPTQRTDGSASIRPRKRRMSSADVLNESIANSICSMGSMFGTASDNIAKLAGCFQFMADDANKKDGVSKEIEKIQGLSLLDRIKAGAIISGDTNKTNYFFSLADDAKPEYVNWVLGGCMM